ncbi:phosphopantetheine-binding protein [Kibdelosporangium persicum]|uniref:Phosphopantetheine attachment site n=1 Tax=Kibdelosporangium persicum TaxID=2698649 RepID=A0ABX2FG90_9PSEU|nr:phosphopantetheine-binding protein [Kibdelosporangium persicum]NRN70390.1 Phosphopantetheine attachment site [Kibdelosporangium persicum]
MDTKTRIRTFLNTRLPDEVRDDEDIFEAGLVNSLFAMQLVLFVEQEFTIRIGNEDLERDNFRSVDAITGLVERHAGVG